LSTQVSSITRVLYFRLDEFSSHDGVPYPQEWVQDRWLPLALLLDRIREAWGGPLLVVSGYRSPARNEAVGGAKASQHVEGRAADIKPLNPDASDALWTMIKDMHFRGLLPRLGGLGRYPGKWVHVDIREGGRLAQWTGAGVGSEIA